MRGVAVLQKMKTPAVSTSKAKSNCRDPIDDFIDDDDVDDTSTDSDSDDVSDDVRDTEPLSDDDEDNDDLLCSTSDKENRQLRPSRSTTAVEDSDEAARKPKLVVNTLNSDTTSSSRDPFLKPSEC